MRLPRLVIARSIEKGWAEPVRRIDVWVTSSLGKHAKAPQALSKQYVHIRQLIAGANTINCFAQAIGSERYPRTPRSTGIFGSFESNT
jgi:hypothetical protein